MVSSHSMPNTDTSINYKGYIHIEAEDAIETNFARRPTTFFFASNRHTLQLNSALPQDGRDFFAQYVFYNTIDREYDIWIAGTPPGGTSNKYMSPISLSFDKGTNHYITSDTVVYSHQYAPAGFYLYKTISGRLSQGKHTLRISINKPRTYDNKCVFYLDAIILIPKYSYSFVEKQIKPSVFPLNDKPAGKFIFPDINAKYVPTTNQQIIEYANCCIWAFEYAKANAMYKTILKANPRNYQANVGYILSYMWMGNNDEAFSQLNTLFEKGYLDKNSEIELKKFLAQQYSWLSRYDDAQQLYKDILKENQNDIEAIIGLGNSYNWAGKVEKAIALYEDALSRLGDNIELMTQLAENYEKNKQYTNAIYMYSKILSKQPDDYSVYQKLGSLYTRTGDKDKAKEILQMSKSRNVVAIVEQGNLMEQGKPEKDEVINAYIDSLQSDFLNTQKHLNLLSVYEWYSKEDAAITEYYTIFSIYLYRELQKNINKYYESLLSTSKVMYLYNNKDNIADIPESTLETLKNSIEKNAEIVEKSVLEKKLSGWSPNISRIIGWLKDGSKVNNEFNIAIMGLIEYLQNERNTYNTLMPLLANESTMLPDNSPILVILQQGNTALLSKNSSLNNTLIQQCVDFLEQYPVQEKLKKGKKNIIPQELITKAQKLRVHILEESIYNCIKDNITFLKRLASYYIHLKDPIGAQEAYDELYKVKPNDVDINLALGDLYKWGRKYYSAARQFEKVLSLDPDNEVAKKARYEVLNVCAPQATVDITTHNEPIVTRYFSKLDYSYPINDILKIDAYYGFSYIKDSLGFLLTPSLYSDGKSTCRFHEVGTNIELNIFTLNTSFIAGYFGRNYNADIELDYLKEYSTKFNRSISHNYLAALRWSPLTVPISLYCQYQYEDVDELVQAIRLGLFQHQFQGIVNIDFSFIPFFPFNRLTYNTSVDYRLISDDNYRLNSNNKATFKLYKNPFKGHELIIGGLYNFETSGFNQYEPDNKVYRTQANLPYYAPIKLHTYGGFSEWHHTIQIKQLTEIGYLIGFQYSRTSRGDDIYNPYSSIYGQFNTIVFKVYGSYMYSKSFEKIEKGKQFKSYDISFSVGKKFFGDAPVKATTVN